MNDSKPTEEIGWPVLHQFFHIDRAHWHSFDDATRGEALSEIAELLTSASAETGMQLIALAGIGKFDFGIMAVHPELKRIQRLGQQIAATTFGHCLSPIYSFLSLSEASEYMTTTADHAKQLIEEKKLDPTSAEFATALKSFEKRMAAYAEARMHPQLPTDMEVIGFYPMSKSRGETKNWYTLSFPERKKLMAGHADTGRKFAGRVAQLITSCTGLDDWEWGVTLFARDLKAVRDVVYEMRFDEGSAVYAQFGEFFVGMRCEPRDLAETLLL